MRAALERLFAHITEKTMVITTSAELAEVLACAYQHHQYHQKKKTGLTVNILYYWHWLKELWREHTRHTIPLTIHCLTEIEEQFLWKNSIAFDSGSAQLLAAADIAQLAQSTWKVIQMWNIHLDDALLQLTQEGLDWLKYANAFTHQCRKNQLITIAELSGYFQKNQILLPKRLMDTLIIVGYEFLPLSIQQWLAFEQQQDQQITIMRFNLVTSSFDRLTAYQNKPPYKNSSHFFIHRPIHHTANPTAVRYRTSLPDSHTELWSMAYWAKKRIENASPMRRIGCVVPTLSDLMEPVLQIFIQVFYTDSLDYVESTAPFQMRPMHNLFSAPSIQAVFLALQLGEANLSRQIVSQFLASPFFGEAETEQMQRARFDQLLRQKALDQLSLHDLLNLTPPFNLSLYCPLLAKRCHLFLKEITQIQAGFCANYSEWGEKFLNLLTILGWPGERTLNKDEYHHICAWILLVKEEYMRLDELASPVSFVQAIETLKEVTHHKMQSVDYRACAPIQILDRIDLTLFCFDDLWITGLDDFFDWSLSFPSILIPRLLQPTMPPVFIPAQAQAIYYQQLLQALQECDSIEEIILSHIRVSAQGMCLQPNPLIVAWPDLAIDELLPQKGWRDHATQTACPNIELQIESKLDHQGPAYPAQHRIQGIHVLMLQALCPFKAFAEYRLQARTLDAPSTGLSRKKRGQIIHSCLEEIWRHLKTQATLIAMEEKQLINVVRNCIKNAITVMSQSTDIYPSKGGHLAIALEKKRLLPLLLNWLRYEKSRPDFTVLAHEKCDAILIGELVFSVRVDRIDAVSKHEYIIIDYKTTPLQPWHEWFGARPLFLQLPAYSLLTPSDSSLKGYCISGIATALISPNMYRFKGVSKTELKISGIKKLDQIKVADAENWEKQCALWQLHLAHLSDELKNGVAMVYPKNKQVCVYCQLKSLCRIQENRS